MSATPGVLISVCCASGTRQSGCQGPLLGDPQGIPSPVRMRWDAGWAGSGWACSLSWASRGCALPACKPRLSGQCILQAPGCRALRPGLALSLEAPQAQDVGLSTRRELGLEAVSKVEPRVGGGGILSPEAPHRSTWRMLSWNQGRRPGCGLWLPPLSSWMKGAPVPSSGPTPPPQVPAASRPHGSSSGLDWGTEAP